MRQICARRIKKATALTVARNETNQNLESHMTQSLQTVKAGEISYIPHGNDEAIKLSLSIIEKQIATPTRSGKKPTQKEMMDFLMLCRARKLNPFEGDAFLVGYDSKDGARFSLITSHQALLKRAELCKEFDGMESGLILDWNGELEETQGDFLPDGAVAVGAWARVHRSDRKIPTYRRLNISRYDKGFGLWKEQREMMAVKCAEADALRSAFPTSTGGMYLREEMPEPSQQQPSGNLFVNTSADNDDDTEFAPTRKLPISQGKHDSQALEEAETVNAEASLL